MSRGTGHKETHLILNVFACFLLPAFTMLFAGEENWLRTNFSLLAVQGRGHYYAFLLWGLTAGSYFFLLLLRLTATLPGVWSRRWLWGGILLACLCLEGALLIPYLPEQFPRYARMHVCLAFAAGGLVMLVLLGVLLCLRREEERCRPLLWAWAGIGGGSVLIFALAGIVTSALEIFVTLSCALLVRRLWILRKNSGSTA